MKREEDGIPTSQSQRQRRGGQQAHTSVGSLSNFLLPVSEEEQLEPRRNIILWWYSHYGLERCDDASSQFEEVEARKPGAKSRK